MIPLYSESRIYVACPGNVATGGPELLHQLVYKLNKIDISGKIFYFVYKDRNNPTPSQYRIYNADYVFELNDHEANVLIIPEIATELIYKYKNIRPVIWWLSVDDYLKRTFVRYAPWKNKVKLFFQRPKYNIMRSTSRDISHFYQSEYSGRFLTENGINNEKMYYLSDYLNPVFMQSAMKVRRAEKKDMILYNPKKGYKYTKSIMKYAPNFNWVPLENKTASEIAHLFKQAKLYIDFGEHPGKDRLPREAVINYCVILTSRNGAAKFYEDIPIPEQYKFETKKENISKILEFIKRVLNEYENHVADFDYYRRVIMRQENDFESRIVQIFAKNDF